MKYYLRLLALPLLFLALFLILFVVWRALALPSGPEFVLLIESWFERYGVGIVLVGSFVEGVLLVGNYFPGSFIIVLSVVLAATPGQAVLAVAVATIGLSLAHLFNYALGRYGWYVLLARFGLRQSIENTRERLIAKGPIAIPASYWSPNLAAVVDTAAGIIRMPFSSFVGYALASRVAWNVLFGLVAYWLGPAITGFISSDANNIYAVLVAIAIWMIVLLVRDTRAGTRGPGRERASAGGKREGASGRSSG